MNEEDIQEVEKGVVYVVIRQTDVVNVIKRSRLNGLKCGVDFGLIAYNNTQAYEVIDEGITALSINWEEMGRKLAHFILTGDVVQEFTHRSTSAEFSVSIKFRYYYIVVSAQFSMDGFN